MALVEQFLMFVLLIKLILLTSPKHDKLKLYYIFVSFDCKRYFIHLEGQKYWKTWLPPSSLT